jgi:hypothetical protein
VKREGRAKTRPSNYLHVLLHSPEDLHALSQVSKQVDLVQDLAHLVHLFILLLQQGVLAKEIEHIENIISIVMKINFFMILF